MQARLYRAKKGNNRTFGGCSRTRALEQPHRLRLFPGIAGFDRMRFNNCSATCAPIPMK